MTETLCICVDLIFIYKHNLFSLYIRLVFSQPLICYRVLLFLLFKHAVRISAGRELQVAF